jgi:hypothetical protein
MALAHTVSDQVEAAYPKSVCLPSPIRIGKRSVGGPASEVAAINRARIAGKPEAEIRALVMRFMNVATPGGASMRRPPQRETARLRDLCGFENERRRADCSPLPRRVQLHIQYRVPHLRLVGTVSDYFREGRICEMTLLALADRGDDHRGSMYPLMASIAEKTSYSKSQAQRTMGALIDLGIVEVVGNHAGGKPGTTCHYRIAIERLTGGTNRPLRIAPVRSN